MTPFKDQPIARKALTLGLAPTISSLVLVSIASVTATYFTARRNTTRDVDAQATIVADSLQTAMSAGDRQAARDTLNLLRGRPNIDVACALDADDALFAAYPGRAGLRCQQLAESHAVSTARTIVVAQPIVTGGRGLGTVLIEGNLSLLYAWMRIQAFVIAGALLGGTLVALSLTRVLQRVISRPILNLAATADRVTTQRDYTLRAVQTTGDEVGGLVQSFNAMLNELQGQNQTLKVEIAERKRAEYLKDEFLASVSHELRTPLNAILGWLQILRTTQGDETRLRRALDSLERNARSQARVIEDLLDVSRMVTGKLQVKLDVVDLRGVIGSAVDTIRPTATAKSLRLDLTMPSSPSLASADRDRLQQAAWNLLSNAVKFTARGGAIEVTLLPVDHDYVISVRDTGAGVTPEFLPYVFDHFRQADGSMTRQHGGLGLGLAIVKEVVELHNGSVAAESGGLGLGATFSIRVPQLVVSAAPADGVGDLVPLSPNPPERRWSGIRILAVDDDLDSLEIVRDALALAGADVRIASSARDAIGTWEREPADVLLCDLAMPGMDGFQLLHSIRELDAAAGRETTAVALTAYTSEEYRVRCLAAGFQAHVGKPYDLQELTAAIDAALAKAAPATSRPLRESESPADRRSAIL